ncbi:uncharacterized protein METZ01_LOCUS445989, partial [marine metagenome]
MKNISIILLLLSLFSCSGNGNKSANRLLKDAEQYRAQGNLKESITSLKSIILNYPN